MFQVQKNQWCCRSQDTVGEVYPGSEPEEESQKGAFLGAVEDLKPVVGIN